MLTLSITLSIKFYLRAVCAHVGLPDHAGGEGDLLDAAVQRRVP